MLIIITIIVLLLPARRPRALRSGPPLDTLHNSNNKYSNFINNSNTNNNNNRIVQYWVFITGGCSGSGVQWIEVASYSKLVYNAV